VKRRFTLRAPQKEERASPIYGAKKELASTKKIEVRAPGTTIFSCTRQLLRLRPAP